MKKTIGIIGFGSFGQFMAKHLVPSFKVYFYDITKIQNNNIKAEQVEIEEVCKVDYLILAVPVQKLESTLGIVSNKLSAKTLVIDVCSIKVLPEELMQKYLPSSTEFLLTHPLFGPKSGANGIAGLNIALCGGRIDAAKYENIKQFLEKNLKLTVVESTAKAHDKQMAYVQGLTHFVAKGFSRMKLPELFLKTASFEHFARITEIVSLDSDELYQVIQDLNPYSKKVRKEFFEKLKELVY